MLELLDAGRSMGHCTENMRSQKRNKLEESGRQKWTKAMMDMGERESKHSLALYRMAKNEFGLEPYNGSSQSQEAIRFWFRMRSGTAEAVC